MLKFMYSNVHKDASLIIPEASSCVMVPSHTTGSTGGDPILSDDSRGACLDTLPLHRHSFAIRTMVHADETVAFYRGDPWAAPGLDAQGNRHDLPELETLTPTEMLQDPDLKNHINVSGARRSYLLLTDASPLMRLLVCVKLLRPAGFPSVCSTYDSSDGALLEAASPHAFRKLQHSHHLRADDPGARVRPLCKSATRRFHHKHARARDLSFPSTLRIRFWR